MITLPELLDDTTYRKYFLTPPRVPGYLAIKASPSWRLWIQSSTDGPWARKDFHTYIDAFRFLKPRLSTLHDGTIQSRSISFQPPSRMVKLTKGGKPVLVKNSEGNLQPQLKLVSWKPKLPEGETNHSWCIYCRRPTVFTWFKMHRAFRGTPVEEFFDPSIKRCTICGVSETIALGLERGAN